MRRKAARHLALALGFGAAAWTQAAQVLGAPAASGVPAAALWDTRSDTWAGADALGRAVPAQGERVAGANVPAPRADRMVGMFYFLWLGEHGSAGPFDISRILARDPKAMSKPNSPLWGPLYAPHHWGEPLFGYYRSDDEWVLRRHAQMLSDAQVDTLIFDASNQLTYPRAYNALCAAFERIRREGGRTPQIAFLAPFGDPSRVVRSLYRELYRPARHASLFFRWQGKPLILADPRAITAASLSQSTREPQRLEATSTLGQSFRAERPLSFVGGSFPTWGASDSGVTLSLLDRPGGRLLARRQLQNIADNALSGIQLPAPLPQGEYYLEMSRPVGQVGWWSATADAYEQGSAFADGIAVTGERDLAVRYEGEGESTMLASSDRKIPLAQAEAEARAILKYFTFRKPQPSYFEGPTAPEQWSWLEVFPQHAFHATPGVPEQVSVGVAQNAVDGRLSMLSHPRSHGRSFHGGKQPTPEEQDFTGRNFAEQWGRALEIDPKFVFVTGWNEWVAGRFPREQNPFYEPGQVNFVDQFSREFSRDIEPMRGGHGDAYFMQLASWVRRYKGARAPQPAGPPRSITIDGRFGDWKGVAPEFRDDRGDAEPRDHLDWSLARRLADRTARNDFESLKMSRDSKYLCAYARAVAPILSARTRPHGEWMSLLLDADADWKTGWRGFDFRVAHSGGRAVVESWRAGSWKRVGRAQVAARGREMEMSIPLGLLGLKSVREVRFKWADNTGGERDALSWYAHGDTAPNGRFAYRYRVPGPL